jgi:hypothetical protein
MQTEFAATCSHCFLARGVFCREDGGDTFLRNVGSQNFYTAYNSEDGILQRGFMLAVLNLPDFLQQGD